MLLAVLLVLGASVSSIGAQDRSTVVRVLQEGSDFRLRVRAAMALGSSGDPHMADALVRALSHDENAAVRAACAEGLGRLAVPSTRSALEGATHDASASVRDAATRALRTLTAAAPAPTTPAPTAPASAPLPSSGHVDWSRTSYIVFVGSLSDRSDFAHARLVTVLGTEVRRALGGIHDVAVIDATGSRSEADREAAARHLPEYRIEGSISRVHRETAGHDLRVRCEVSLVLMDDTTHNIRAALNGAATGSEPAPTTAARPARERYLAEQALTSATRSAMSGASRAITGH
ncbi:MAG: HEAT repeat domain-containing protein [Sandaracinus sp.]